MDRAVSHRYIGEELDLFALATNWKRYVKKLIGAHLVGDVLEVGAGIGGTTVALHDGTAHRWVCLEPDTAQALRLQTMTRRISPGDSPFVVAGSLDGIAARPCFDCVLYLDVLEHIPDDGAELKAASKLLRKGGHLVVLSPAHQWLFSEFDRSIGHLRRYDKKSLRQIEPPLCREKRMAYIDAAGLFLSLGNTVALKQSLPSRWQIRTWDKICIPFSRVLDPILLERFGKSILAVWEKTS